MLDVYGRAARHAKIPAGAIGEKMGFALVHVRAWLGKEWGEPG